MGLIDGKHHGGKIPKEFYDSFYYNKKKKKARR
jgi:hypothetical protein